MEPGGVKRQGRILLVDDNASNRLVVRQMLEDAGFTLAEAHEGRASLERVERESFDLILMDCSMPVMDGCAATRAIREWEKGTGRPSLPIVGLTANATAAQRQRCFASGMNDVLFKPLPCERLVETCAQWIERK